MTVLHVIVYLNRCCKNDDWKCQKKGNATLSFIIVSMRFSFFYLGVEWHFHSKNVKRVLEGLIMLNDTFFSKRCCILLTIWRREMKLKTLVFIAKKKKKNHMSELNA